MYEDYTGYRFEPPGPHLHGGMFQKQWSWFAGVFITPFFPQLLPAPSNIEKVETDDHWKQCIHSAGTKPEQ